MAARMSADDSPVRTTGITPRMMSAPGLDGAMADSTGMPGSEPTALHRPAQAKP